MRIRENRNVLIRVPDPLLEISADRFLAQVCAHSARRIQFGLILPSPNPPRTTSYTYSLPSHTQPMGIPMAPPTSPALQNLHRLDFSSLDFQDQLCDALSGQEYVRCIPDLEEGALVWLANYLDEVFCSFAIPSSLLEPP